MSEQTVYVAATRAEVREAFTKIPQAAMGGYGTRDMADALMVRCGLALLGHIRAAFVAKSRGGTDEAGDSWKPLSPKTVAYSRRNRKVFGDPGASRLFSRAKSMPWVPKSVGRAGFAPSYALTDKQRERWWEVYRQQLARFRGNKGSAAKVAWATVKREGATTLMEQFGGMKVDILRDTGLLLNSLSPGVGSAEQVFRVGTGEVVVGTNRKWAAVHHHGSKDGRIPQRRLWPDPARWPVSWWLDIAETARSGLVDITLYLLRKIA